MTTGKTSRVARRVLPSPFRLSFWGALALACALSAAGCAPVPIADAGAKGTATKGAANDGAWTSPADDAALARLEAKTLGRGVSKKERARLFFLWGQELASNPQTRDRAIGAFERVVDLGSILADESRFNLEILYRERETQSQESKDNREQRKDNDKQDAGNGRQQDGKESQKKENGKDDSGNGKDTGGAGDANGQKSGAEGKPQGADSGREDAQKPKDLSALVRDKEAASDLDAALKAELDRRNERERAETGTAVPVEKDW